MKNSYLKTAGLNSETKKNFRRAMAKFRIFFFLFLLPASSFAQLELGCCVTISSSADTSNPLLRRFCIHPCTSESNIVPTWNFGDGSPVVTTLDSCVTHLYAAPGKYEVCIHASLCMAEPYLGIPCIIDTCLSIVVTKEPTLGVETLPSAHPVLVFPNPASAFINITSGDKNISQVKMLNLLGEELALLNVNSNHALISTAHLANGIYFLKIYFSDNRITVKKIRVLGKK